MTATITTSARAAQNLTIGMKVRDTGLNDTGVITEIDTTLLVPMVTVDCGNNRELYVCAMYLEPITDGTDTEQPATATDGPTNIYFETEPCPRCSGRGRYCGGVCFLCDGARTRLTSRGNTAKNAYDKLMTERASDPIETVTTGTRVYCPASGYVGFELKFFGAKYRTVTKVTTTQISNGVTGDTTTSYTLWFGENLTHSVSADNVIRVSRPELNAAHVEIMRAIGSGRYKGASLDRDAFRWA